MLLNHPAKDKEGNSSPLPVDGKIFVFSKGRMSEIEMEGHASQVEHFGSGHPLILWNSLERAFHFGPKILAECAP